MGNRIYYELESFRLNTYFELQQCFCSCMGEHYKECPNFGKKEPEKYDPEITIIANFEGERYKLTAKIKEYKWEKLEDIENKPE